jgi:hypothetical protein
MLPIAFFNNSRFIVLERQAVQGFLIEQDLSARDWGKRQTAVPIPIGELEGAERALS